MRAVAMFTVPAHALYFGGYEMAKRVQRREGTREGDEGALAHFSAGLVADLCGALLWCPQAHLPACAATATRSDVLCRMS